MAQKLKTKLIQRNHFKLQVYFKCFSVRHLTLFYLAVFSLWLHIVVIIYCNLEVPKQVTSNLLLLGWQPRV